MISNTKNYAVVMFYPVTLDVVQMFEENLHPVKGMKSIEGPTRIFIMDLK